ncbi:hypothetical protein [Flavobacterium sp.]|nr:hypothetical protein [Flavobacterium sp.]
MRFIREFVALFIGDAHLDLSDKDFGIPNLKGLSEIKSAASDVRKSGK